jgi:hypothetical protein
LSKRSLNDTSGSSDKASITGVSRFIPRASAEVDFAELVVSGKGDVCVVITASMIPRQHFSGMKDVSSTKYPCCFEERRFSEHLDRSLLYNLSCKDNFRQHHFVGLNTLGVTTLGAGSAHGIRPEPW